MYKVNRLRHEQYGNVIEIIRSENGILNPFDAYYKSKYMRRQWIEESLSKVRFLVDNQLLTEAQTNSWAKDEYKSLPKCEECAALLNEDVFTHAQSKGLFCTKKCADKNYVFQVERMNDNEESEFDL